MKRLDLLALVISLAAASTVVWMLVRRPTEAERQLWRGQALVMLADTGDRCAVTYKSPTVSQKKQRPIRWTIMNGCESEATVDLREFTSGDPLDRTCTRAAKVPAGRTRNIVCTVDQSAVEGRSYPYKLGLNGTTQSDPEIVVEYD